MSGLRKFTASETGLRQVQDMLNLRKDLNDHSNSDHNQKASDTVTSDESTHDMDKHIDDNTHPIFSTATVHGGVMKLPSLGMRSHPPLDSLIKILDPTSTYHNYYAQVKYRYSSPKGFYILKIFIESGQSYFHLERAMKLINYAYPSTEEAVDVASKFLIGKPDQPIDNSSTAPVVLHKAEEFQNS
jgi:hypothetical protein